MLVTAPKPNLPSITPDWRQRVVCDPAIRHGEPTIRGTRVPVALLVGSRADMTIDDLLKEFPQITRDDLAAALRFAAESSHNSMVA